VLKEWVASGLRQLDTKVDAFLKAYAEIFFLHGKWPGLIILGITCLNPQMAIAGILAVLSAFIFASFIGYRQIFLNSGFYTYNTLLIGFSIGATFSLNPVTLLLLGSVSVLSFVFSVFLANMFFTSFRLPILSIPFVLVTSVIYLAAGKYSNLYVSGLYAKHVFDGFDMLHPVVMAFFKSMGSIIFLPDVRAGMLLALLLLWHSRVLFVLAILGFGVGGLAHGIYIGSASLAMQDPSSFNYILIAMAIGGVFLIPSVQSVVIALTGVLIATVLIDAVSVFWTQFAIPVFTLPFTVVTLLFVYVLNLIDHPLCTRVFKETPEKILDYYLTTARRFCKEYPITVPFHGTWTVYQCFDGQWTHKGLWRYAYDFVQTNPSENPPCCVSTRQKNPHLHSVNSGFFGSRSLPDTFSEGFVSGMTEKTYDNEGLRLADYFCYRQPVNSPVYGRVVWVIRHLPDNPIGTVDTVNNWGNMVMIYDARGFYAVLAHFAENSIVVNEGDWVAPWTFLGECGNSGYSPQPHIHMHLQWTMAMTSMTIPFRFLGYELRAPSPPAPLPEGEGRETGSKGRSPLKSFFSARRSRAEIVGGYHTHAIPPEGACVTHAPFNAFWDQLTNFTLDDTLTFDIFEKKRHRGAFSMKVSMAVDGTFCWETPNAKLYFGKLGNTFFCFHIEGEDPYLRMIYLALPKMPLAGDVGLQWQDDIPYSLCLTGWRRAVAGFFGIVAPAYAGAVGSYQFTSHTEISGAVAHILWRTSQKTKVVLDPSQQIVGVSLGTWELRRV